MDRSEIFKNKFSEMNRPDLNSLKARLLEVTKKLEVVRGKPENTDLSNSLFREEEMLKQEIAGLEKSTK